MLRSLSANAVVRFNWWASGQYNLDKRLAHACTDGKIRAPRDVEYYMKRNGGVSIYGHCHHCNVPLSAGIKFIIIMEYELD
jgi:hypothetical protein